MRVGESFQKRRFFLSAQDPSLHIAKLLPPERRIQTWFFVNGVITLFSNFILKKALNCSTTIKVVYHNLSSTKFTKIWLCLIPMKGLEVNLGFFRSLQQPHKTLLFRRLICMQVVHSSQYIPILRVTLTQNNLFTGTKGRKLADVNASKFQPTEAWQCYSCFYQTNWRVFHHLRPMCSRTHAHEGTRAWAKERSGRGCVCAHVENKVSVRCNEFMGASGEHESRTGLMSTGWGLVGGVLTGKILTVAK